jgi:hypothetical protein
MFEQDVGATRLLWPKYGRGTFVSSCYDAHLSLCVFLCEGQLQGLFLIQGCLSEHRL